MSERRVRSSGRQMYGSREPLRRPRKARWQRPSMSLWQRRLILLAALVILAAWGLNKAFGATSVVVIAPQRTAEIQGEATKLVHGSIWQGNLLTLNGGVLASDLQQVDPVLRTVSVGRRWFHTVVVTATLKQPTLGWVTGDQTYLLDKTGTVIGNFPGGSVLPVVTDQSNLPVNVGQQVAPEQFISFVSLLVPALAADGYVVKGLSISDSTFDLTVSTNKGYNLIFDTSRTVASEISDLKAVQVLMASQKATPAKYVDLRVVGRAYWE